MSVATCKMCPEPVKSSKSPYCSTGCFKEYERVSGRARAKKRSTLYHRAHELVSVAVSQGRLKRQPCEICADTRSVVAHHDDYAKPLDVRWLCLDHHQQHHARFGPGLNAFRETYLAAYEQKRGLK